MFSIDLNDYHKLFKFLSFYSTVMSIYLASVGNIQSSVKG